MIGSFVQELRTDTCFTENEFTEIEPIPCDYQRALKEGNWEVFDYKKNELLDEKWKTGKLLESKKLINSKNQRDYFTLTTE